MLLSLLWTQLFGSAVGQIAGPGHFFFEWPTQTSQCQHVSLTWADAVPPFSAWVIPLGQQPFIYDIPDSSYSDGFGRYDIQLQLNQGTNYVMLMSDGRGMGSGGTSNTQIVGSSPNTTCLNSAAQNQTAKEFSFSVAGIAEQCEKGFELSWDGKADNAPYNFTVIPLQQGYYPFDVDISETSGYTRDWAVNMTQGTKFTVVMNNKNGYGTGGAAGIYEIANATGGGDGCIIQSLQPTAIWPVGVATNTLPVATNSGSPGDDDNGGSGIGSGAIAGIVIGVLAALAILAFLLFWFLRRRRRSRTDGMRNKEQNHLDLADGAAGYDDPLRADHGNVSPYISHNHLDAGGTGSGSPVEAHSMTATPHRSDSGNRSENSAAGFAGLGAASAYEYAEGRPSATHGDRSRQVSNTHDPSIRDSWAYSNPDMMGYAMEDGELRSGPGIAPPLPQKGTPFRPASSQPTITTRPDSGYQQSSVGQSGKRDSSLTLQSRSGFGAGFGSGTGAGAGAGAGMGDVGSGGFPPLPPGAGLGHSSSAGRGGQGGGGGMRVVNHDNPDDLPAISSSGLSQGQGQGQGQSRHAQRNSHDYNRRMEFRRHADAGRVDYVDLPPLYTDVPRDAAMLSGPPQLDEGGRGASHGSGNSGNSGVSGQASPTSPHTPLLADVDPLQGAGEQGRRPSPLARDNGL